MKKIFVVLLTLCLIFGYGGVFAMDEQTVVLETNQGDIEIKLKVDVAPKACENFIKLEIGRASCRERVYVLV